MNVLALCFQASPSKGSESSVGWGWLKTIASDHNVWVITNDAAREEVEAAYSADTAFSNVHFTFVPWNTRGVGSRIWPFLRPFKYARWRRRALAAALNICTKQQIDLCHYVNAVGFRDVVPLWKTGLPFVWGPVGGLAFVHPAMLKHVDFRARLFYRLKDYLRSVSIRYSSLPREAAKHAAAIIAATEQTRSAMQKAWGTGSTVIAEIGRPDQVQDAAVTERLPGTPLKIVWSGRVHSGKAPLLALQAVAALDSSIDWQLIMIGDGPDREKLLAAARAAGVAERFQITGWLPRDAALEQMASAHLFILTSVYDLTSNVLVEAMSNGLPVICLSSQAAAAIVGDRCGLTVPVDAPGGIAMELSAAIKSIYENEDERLQKAENSLSAAKDFDWQAKRVLLQEIYRSSISA